MGTVLKTITLTEQQDAWLKSRIDEGRYTDDGEAIRDLIRREQERAADQAAGLATLRQALIEGELSGEPEPFDIGAFMRRKAAELGAGRLACADH